MKQQPLYRWLSVVFAVGMAVLAAPRLAAGEAAAQARMKRDLTFLASDECEGRGVETQGINRAADYIARAFQEAGLKPAGPDGDYFQPFTINGGSKLVGPNTLTLHGPYGQDVQLQQGQQFQVVGLSASGHVSAPVVFAGYGITSKEAGYDDYQGLDVRGKVVVLLRSTPRAANRTAPFAGNIAYYGGLATKLANAEAHQAAAVLFVNEHGMAAKEDRLMEFAYTAFEKGGRLPALQIRRALLDQMLSPEREASLGRIEEDIDRELRPHCTELAGWTAEIEVHVEAVRIPAKNIIGVLDGAGPLAQETVVIGAHYDHLGYGGFGSLARPGTKAIHHGADDNASGTTMLMELARRFGRQQERQGRRLVFIAFSGEERGLLGSAYYCDHPMFPLEQTIAMINMDMVGRLRANHKTHKDDILVYGTGSAANFDKLIDALNGPFGFQLGKVPTGMGPSDQQSFYLKKIPVYFFFTDTHDDYHKPSDTSDKINYPGMARVSDFVEQTIVHLESMPERPQYVKVNTPVMDRTHMSGPRLGIQPSYATDAEDGVLLNGVSPGAPAARAGLREGDRIIEIGGKPIKNLQTYMAVMSGQKKGDQLDVGILRDGKRLTITVKLD